MSCMQPPSIHIPKPYSRRYLSPIRRSRNDVNVSFFLATCPVQSIFLLDVVFTLVVPWHNKFAARLNLPSSVKKGVSTTQHAISPSPSAQVDSSTTFRGSFR